MLCFARDIIMQLDPEDYHSFISEGKKRPKNYPQISTDSAAISKIKGIIIIIIIFDYLLSS